MKQLLKAVAVLFLCAVPALASTATATLTDTDGTVWANCTYTATITILGGTSTPAPTISGVTVSPLVVKGSCSASGVISATLTDTSTVDQKNVQWVFKVQPNASVPSVTVSTPVVGTSPSLTQAFSLLAPPRFATGANAYGYADVEVQGVPQVGATYYNVTTPCLRQYSLAGWTCGGGSGNSPAVIKTGLMALYVPSSCSGATYTDISGNGNNGTLATSTAAPTCNANGVSFVAASKQYISLPAALNSAKTIQIFTIPLVIARGASTGQGAISELLGSATSAGEHIFGYSELVGNHPFNDSTNIYAGGYTTSINDTTSLPSLYTWDLSCTLDHVYVNDQEASSYGLQGTTCNKQTTSNLQLGGSAGLSASNFSSFTVSVAAFYSTELTAQQVAANYQAIKSYLQNTVGLSFTVKPNGGSTPTLVCSGIRLKRKRHYHTCNAELVYANCLVAVDIHRIQYRQPGSRFWDDERVYLRRRIERRYSL